MKYRDKHWRHEGRTLLEKYLRDSYLIKNVREVARTRANCDSSIIDLLFTNEEGMTKI